MTAGRNSGYNKTDWNTPQKYVNAVLDVFGEIDLDPCSNEGSIVPAFQKFILPFYDGLEEDWCYSRIYVNPPFGKGLKKTTIYDWLKKCYYEHNRGKRNIIALIPVATNTKHWKEFVFKADVICFLSDTRLKFRVNGSEDNKGASMACAMVYWGNQPERFKQIFDEYGYCVRL